MVQPQEKYEHIGEEIKMMDLLADVCSCASCTIRECVRVCLSSAEFAAATVGALCSGFSFSLPCTSFSDLYNYNSITWYVIVCLVCMRIKRR